MNQAYDVCIVENDEADRHLIAEILSRAGFTSVSAADAEPGWKRLCEHHPKVILSDWNLPGQDGLQLCKRVREAPDLCASFFIILTCRDEKEHRSEALRHGADDYLTKPVDPDALVARVRMGVRMGEANDRLRQAAITDGLTGLYNHDYLNAVIDRELNRARRYGGDLSLLMLDLDFFKAINDTYGHLVGNATLIEVAHILRDAVRDTDFVGRFGGEEFVIVAPETNLSDAAALADRIRLGISDTLRIEALSEHTLTVSIGVAGIDDVRVRSSADLVDLADRALYVAKRTGRNRVATTTDLPGEDTGSLMIDDDEVETLRKRVAILSTQTKNVYVQSVASLLQVLDEKDRYTAKHSLNVSHYGMQIARAMDLSESVALSIRNAGLLHDIGKVGIPDSILTKPGPLTLAEAAIMRRVPMISVRIIDHLGILESEVHIIRHQREYFDGSGYPEGLHGQQIPVGARVILVANAFDAMTTDRTYHQRVSIDQALENLRKGAGSQFDPQIVKTLEQLIDQRRDEFEERINAAQQTHTTTAVLL